MILFNNKETAELQHREHKALYVLLSFFIPFIVLTLVLIGLRIVPFGDKHSLAISDAKFYLNGQIFIARLLRGEENWLYSLNNGLGNNELSILAWGGIHLASFLSLFATLETIPSLFSWMIVFNMSVCGLTMYLLLACLFGHKSSHLIFSTSYAMIGFLVANCYQLLFYTGPQFLPLVVLGLVKLLRGKSPLVYILSLGTCIILNFYFGFHLCVISVILFFAYLYLHWDELAGKVKGLFVNWALSSLFAGLLGAVVWLPTLKAYSGGGRLNQTDLDEYIFSEKMPFVQIFSKLFSGANSANELINGLPNIFCGILVVALVILFFMDKKIAPRFKKAAAVVLGFYLISFYIPAFTILMHGGTHTNWFPFRYSYVFSFLLILLAAEEFERLDEITLADTKRCGTALLVGVLLVFGTRYEFVTGGAVLLDLALLLLMWLGFYLYKTKPETTPKSTLSLFLLLVVCANLYANFYFSTAHVREQTEWELDLEEYNKNIMTSGVLTEAVDNLESGFFRMEKDKSESQTVGADPALYNYNGVSNSGPAIRAFVHQELCKLGINWFDMRHWYSEGIPAATDTLLGLKYILSERDLTEEKNYEKLVVFEGTGVYKNASALSPAILSEADVLAPELGDNVFDNLNLVWKAMTGGEQDVFTAQEDVTYTLITDYASQTVTSRELKTSAFADGEEQEEKKTNEAEPSSYFRYSFTAEQDGPIYYADTSIPGSPNGLSEPAIKYVGFYHKGDIVEGKIPIVNGIGTGDFMRGYCANLAFAYADNAQLEQYAAQLNSRDISFNVVHENDLTGSFTAAEGQRILFTIPWDEGWTCFIDGVPTPIDRTWNLFMSVEVPAGQHSYEMKFFPAWMNYGVFLSALSVVGVVLLKVLGYKYSGHSDDRSNNQSDEHNPEKKIIVNDQETVIYKQTPETVNDEAPKRQSIVVNNLKKIKNLNELSASHAFILVSVIGMVATATALFVSHGELFGHYFWYDTRDVGMDFFNSIQYLHGNKPYSLFNTLYPPLANLLFAFLYDLMPSEVTENLTSNIFDSLTLRASAYDLRSYQAPMVVFVVFVISSILLTTLVIQTALRQKNSRLQWGVVLSSICSYAMISAYERGNIIVLSFALTMVFILTYRNQNKMISEIGLLSLAVAAGLKLYPALFGVLLLREKRYKQAVRAIFYGVLSIVLPALLLGDGLSGLKIWFATLTGDPLFTYGKQSFDYSASGILWDLKMLLLASNIAVDDSVLKVGTVLLLSIPCVCFFIDQEYWKQIRDITLFILLYSSQGSYGLIFVLLYMVIFFRDDDRIMWSNFIPLFCSFLLVMHTPIFYDAASGLYRMPFYHIVFSVMLIAVVSDTIRSWQANRKTKTNLAVA